MENQIEQDENAFVPLRARLLATLDNLRSECPTALGDYCYRAIRHALLDARLLPPHDATFRRWYRAVCRHADGTDYSHSQRALFVRQFNAVGRRWAENGLTDRPLRVTNYRRRRPGGVADARVYQTIRPSEMRRLQGTFLCLDRDTESDATQEEAQWEAFCRMAFVLIVWGGMAWPGALTMLCGLQWQHIRIALNGYIRIPRRGVWLRLYLQPLAQAFALALGAHLPRARMFGEPDGTQSLIPFETEAGDPAQERRRRQIARRRFDKWLRDLCVASGARPIGLRVLQEAARVELARMYGNVLAGAILGLTRYAPAADGQEDVFETYRGTLTLPGLSLASLPALASPRPYRPESTHCETSNSHLEEMIARVQNTLRPLIARETGSRAETANALDALARELLGAPAETDLSAGLAAAREQVDGDTFNVAVLAVWLAHLCRDTSLTPSTVGSYRSAGSVLVRHWAGVSWHELDEDDAQEVVALDRSETSRSRFFTVMASVIGYLRQTLGMKTTLEVRVALRLGRTLRPVNLIGWEDVERLLAQLLAWKQRALLQKTMTKARLAHNAFFAVLLACFFGLRRREICCLRLGDIVLDAQTPYLRVWRSKRGRSRVVWAREVPAGVLNALRAEWKRRWKAAKENPAARFLDSEEDMDTLVESVGRAVNAALRVMGLSQSPDALPVTFHTLRHVYANRLLVLNVPLVEIARSMGHSDTDTTTGSYLHAFDFLQRRRLQESLAAQPRQGVTATQIGELLGINRTAVLAALKKLPPAECAGWQEGDCHVYPWTTVVRLLVQRLRIKV